MENCGKEKRTDVCKEGQMKVYYVDFYDMVDMWGGFGFFNERLFDDLDEAIKLCDKLNDELNERNKSCGEHYGVIHGESGREIYCGLDRKCETKMSELGEHFLGLGKNKIRKNDEYVRKSKPKDEYQEVAEEIVREIKDDLFDYADFDSTSIVNVLRRRFDVSKENVGKILMSEVTMFGIYDGNTFELPMFGILAFSKFGVIPIISGVSYPNYNIRNKYMGYTNDGVFHRVGWQTEFWDSVKKNPSVVLISAVAAYVVINALLNL